MRSYGNPGTQIGEFTDSNGRPVGLHEFHPETAMLADMDGDGHTIRNVKLAGDVTSSQLRQFSLTNDFGAVAGEDCTDALNDAIGTAFEEGGGDIVVPLPRHPEEEKYLISSAFQDTARQNAQILLPVVAIGDRQVTIRIRGEVSPGYSGSGVYPIDPPRASTFKSTQPSPTGSTPSMFGGYGPIGGPYNEANFLHLELENLVFECPPNPLMSALYFYRQTDVHLKNILVHTGVLDAPRITEPTHTGSYGIIMPNDSTGPGNEGSGSINVYGFYTGLKGAELINFATYNAWSCKRGLEVAFGNHAMVIGKMLAFWCTRCVQIDGTCGLNIGVLDIEKAADASAWYATEYEIHDASNAGRGMINRYSVVQNVGADETPILRNGALGFDLYNLNTMRRDTNRINCVTDDDTTPETVTAPDDDRHVSIGQSGWLTNNGAVRISYSTTNNEGYVKAIKPGAIWSKLKHLALEHWFKAVNTAVSPPPCEVGVTIEALRVKRESYPKLILEATANTADARKFQIFVAPSGALRFEGLNDLETVEGPMFEMSRDGTVEFVTVLVDNRATHPTPIAGKTHLWTRTSDGALIATDGDGVDHQLDKTDTGWGAMTGTGSKLTIAAAAAGSISGAYVQAEVQAIANRIAALEARLKSLDTLLFANKTIGA